MLLEYPKNELFLLSISEEEALPLQGNIDLASFVDEVEDSTNKHTGSDLILQRHDFCESLLLLVKGEDGKFGLVSNSELLS